MRKRLERASMGTWRAALATSLSLGVPTDVAEQHPSVCQWPYVVRVKARGRLELLHRRVHRLLPARHESVHPAVAVRETPTRKQARAHARAAGYAPAR